MPDSHPLVYGEGLSLVRVADVLWRRARLVLGLPVAFAAMGVAVSFLVGVEYSARSSFLPQTTTSSLGQVAGLAAQLGLSVPSGSATGDGPDFYADLLKSENLLREAVLAEYRVARSPGSPDSIVGTLLDIWNLKGSGDDRERSAVDRLRRVLSPQVAARTGVVTLVTRAKWPELAVQLNQRLLDLITRFNADKRRSQAASERAFVESRLEDARKALAGAEEELERFQERNRRYQSSPELNVEAGRLERQVNLRQQVYASLAQSYEKARIDEVRNTPVVTFIDSPGVLLRDSGRHLGRNAALGLLLGALLGTGIAFFLEYLQREAERYPADYDLLRSRLKRLLPVRRNPS